MDLWAFIAEKTDTGFRTRQGQAALNDLHIVPAQGKGVLCLAKDVVRLGEKRLLQSVQDWDFLSQYLIVLTQNWTRYLADAQRLSVAEDDSRKVKAAYFILNGARSARKPAMSIRSWNVSPAIFLLSQLVKKLATAFGSLKLRRSWVPLWVIHFAM